MASNIDYISIDETYPIAGRDNDSQGFRDNFAIIKNSFQSAKGEIEDLQVNTARVDQASNFNNQNIVNANFLACTEELYEAGEVSVNTVLNWQEGSYQKLKANANIKITLSGFPGSGVVGKMRLELSADSTRTITFDVANGGTLIKSSALPTNITFTSNTEFLIFDFWTYTGGNKVFMDYVGRFV